MKKFQFILALCLSNFAFSQSKMYLTVSASQSVSLDDIWFTKWNRYFENQFIGTNISIGGKILTKKGSIFSSLEYQYGGGWYTKFYEFDYHLLGVSLEYRFFNEQKAISPIFGTMFLTEIASNYKGKYLLDYRPTDYISKTIDTRFYKSTPLVGNINLGADFRIIKNLNLDLNIGYGFRVIKTQYGFYKGLEFYKTDNNRLAHFIDIQLKMRYTIPMKNHDNQ